MRALQSGWRQTAKPAYDIKEKRSPDNLQFEKLNAISDQWAKSLRNSSQKVRINIFSSRILTSARKNIEASEPRVVEDWEAGEDAEIQDFD